MPMCNKNNMKNTIREIQIVFENGEYAIAPGIYVDNVEYKETTHDENSDPSIQYRGKEIDIPYDTIENPVYVCMCKQVQLRLNHGASQISTKMMNNKNTGNALFRRITGCPDIIGIIIVYNHGPTICLNISWVEAGDDSNALQKANITSDHRLAVRIGSFFDDDSPEGTGRNESRRVSRSLGEANDTKAAILNDIISVDDKRRKRPINGLTDRKMMRSLVMARRMRDIMIRSPGICPNSKPYQMFILGLLHNIGFEYCHDIQESVSHISAALVPSEAINSNDIYFCGDANTQYHSAELDLLNYVDLTTSEDGKEVDVNERLKEITMIYGARSYKRINSELLARKLGLLSER